MARNGARPARSGDVFDFHSTPEGASVGGCRWTIPHHPQADLRPPIYGSTTGAPSSSASCRVTRCRASPTRGHHHPDTITAARKHEATPMRINVFRPLPSQPKAPIGAANRENRSCRQPPCAAPTSGPSDPLPQCASQAPSARREECGRKPHRSICLPDASPPAPEIDTVRRKRRVGRPSGKSAHEPS